MKIVFFTSNYPPDLGAGSFRSVALAQSINKKLKKGDQIHVITLMPNRYNLKRSSAKDTEINELITIHRIKIPSYKEGIIAKSYSYLFYSFKAFILCRKLKPDFLIGTSSRLMTAVLTYLSAKFLKKKYCIDLRDIFSDTISAFLERKNKVVAILMKSFFVKIERTIFNSAAIVNVVSESFSEYYKSKGISTSHWVFFPNGVDEEFRIANQQNKEKLNKIKTILYAGNIGHGQGLHKVIPKIATTLSKDFQIKIIGAGSAHFKLKNCILKNNNVELISPVERKELKKHYQEADVLFLHLNDLNAFKRVLPSKIFEYVATGIPIVAGLSGYSASFLKENVPHALIFNPGDARGASNCILDSTNIKVSKKNVNAFVTKYSRESIMNNFSSLILVAANENI